MFRWCDFVILVTASTLLVGRSEGIIQANEEPQKPSYTPGIKTTSWKSPNSVQNHQNYSKVYVHNSPDGHSQYVVAQTERTLKVYPVYNAHAYGANESDTTQGRLFEIPSQGHGHFASLVGRNATGSANRTIYKRKIQFKTVDVYDKCPEGATGQFVYSLNCNQFLNCWRGRGQPQNCSPGTLFNPKTLECDYPEKVECITGPRQNTLEGARFQKSATQALCPKEFTGLIPNYTDCSKFINCNNGQRYSMDCPPGTLFDINTNVCDFAYKSTCFNGQSDAGTANAGAQYNQGQGEGQGQHNVNSKLDFGQDQTPSGSGYFYSRTSCPVGSPNCRTNFAQSSYTSTSGLATTCNPLVQNCDGVRPTTFSYYQGQSYEGPRRQYSFGRHNIKAYQNCNDHNNYCGRGSLGYYNTYSQGQDAGQGRGSTSTTTNYNKVCNINDPNCHRNGNTNVATDDNTLKCPSNFQGLTRHPNDCTKFLNCAGGQTYVQSCGPGTFFSSSLGSCGYSTDECANAGTATTAAPDIEEAPSQGHTTRYRDQEGYEQGHTTYPQGQNGNQNHGQGGYNQGQATYYQWQGNYGRGRHRYNQGHGHGHTYYQGPGRYDPSQGGYNQGHGTFYNNYNDSRDRYNEEQDGDQSNSTQSHLSSSQGQGNYNQGHGWNNRGQGGDAQDPTSESQGQNNYNHGSGWNSQSQGGYSQGRPSGYQGQSNYYQWRDWTGSGHGHGNGGYWSGSGRPTQSPGYDGGYWTHSQGHGHYDHGRGRYDHGYDITTTERPTTPRLGDVAIVLGQSGDPAATPARDAGSGRPTQSPAYDGGYWTHSQGHGHYDHGRGRYDQGYDITTTERPTTPRLGDVTIVLGQSGDPEPTTARDVDRGQIGVVSRPSFSNRDQTVSNFPDYSHAFGTTYPTQHSTSPRSVWPPPYPSTDVNADYVFEYDDGEPVTISPDDVFFYDRSNRTSCNKPDFFCTRRSCVSNTMVCDGHRDCENGKDEKYCDEYVESFATDKNHRLDVLEKQRWINVSHTTCAYLCIETKIFHCRSFNYRRTDRICYLTDSNVGLSGTLYKDYPYDYYELKSATINCTGMYRCQNGKCITRGEVCDGVDDCGNREDERGCKPEDFGYSVKLAGSTDGNEGRVEITAFGRTGYICDDKFGILDANVVCRELGFPLGAAEFKGNSYYAKDVKGNKTEYLMDDLDCFGNETTLLDCGFSGWGVHNCLNDEIAGVTCKTPQEKCGKSYWKCDTGNECIPISFVCDSLYDCTDGSDEGSQHCEAPTEMRLVNGSTNKEGRIEIKHHGVWGTICDDDFNEDAGKVACKYFGFKGVVAVKKESYFGRGGGPIWLDQVSCYGNETLLNECTHWNWGEHNCDHGEDVGVICTNDYDVLDIQRNSKAPNTFGTSTKTSSLPSISCGFRKDNQFLENDLIHARVISGSIARRGDYPWQAALRVKGKGKAAHWCGAVVISRKWVLTAAHCLQGYAKGAYVIAAGEYNTDEDEGTEQEKYIEEYFIHEDFRKGHKMNNDIALIKLKHGGFVLNDDVQPICLPDLDADYERELNCTVSGFGSVKSGVSAYSHDMRAAWIPVHNRETCKMPHVYGDAITEGMICAGFLDGGVDACDGDSGGPLACLDDGLFTLYGLTSWGQHCGYANKPGVYVKIAHYRRWIDDIISRH